MDRYGINFELTNLGGRSDELAGESLFPLGPARALYEVGLLRKWGHPPSDISEDRIQRGTALYNFVHANRGCGNIAATGIDQRAEGENYPATVLDFPNFQKDPETGVYRMEHTANSRKGETTIVPSGFVLFVPGEKRLYDGFGFAHQTTTDKGEAIASQEAYFKRLGLDPASALKAAKEETSYSRRSDNESGVFAVRRDFWGEVSGPWYVNTSYRPGNRNDDVGAVLPRRVRAEATEEYTNLVKAANDAYEIFEQGMSDE